MIYDEGDTNICFYRVYVYVENCRNSTYKE